MTTRRRTFFMALPIFAALAFLPVINGQPKMGWIQVWAAYPAVFFCIREGEWDSILAVASAVIVAHAAVSIGVASLLCRVLFRNGHGKRELQPGDAPKGGPGTSSGDSDLNGGRPR